MKRRTRNVLAIATVTVALAVQAPSPASATVVVPLTTGATAYSAASSTGTGALNASLTLTGALGGLLGGLITPIVNTALNPLLAVLHGTVNTLVASLLGASSALNVGVPSAQSTPKPIAFPTDLISGVPLSCGSLPTKPCYQGASIVGLGAPLANINLSTVAGYTQQVLTAADSTNPILARAQLVAPSVSVLPGVVSLLNPVVSVATVDALASCPNDIVTAPSVKLSATTVTVLGGLVTLDVTNGLIANLKVGGTSYAQNLLPILNLAGVIVQPFGSAVKVTIPLGVTDLLNGLGLPLGAVTELLGDTLGDSLSLSIILGPNAQVTSTTAKAWGLGIGVDLSGTLSFNLLGVVGAAVTVPSGIGGGNYGNLADLRLAYASCASGSVLPGSIPAVPPALV
jgi:hypothetical protein